jgi:HPr kinase/phosphorylase
MRRVHATCVAIGRAAVLLRGPSAAGKSDLALRLIDAGARLVADDQVELRRAPRGLVASAPKAIAGLLEARGVGLMRVPALAGAPVVLAVDLVAPGRVARLPTPKYLRLLGVSVPRLALAPFEASAPAKVRLAARAASLGRLWSQA